MNLPSAWVSVIFLPASKVTVSLGLISCVFLPLVSPPSTPSPAVTLKPELLIALAISPAVTNFLASSPVGSVTLPSGELFNVVVFALTSPVVGSFTIVTLSVFTVILPSLSRPIDLSVATSTVYSVLPLSSSFPALTVTALEPATTDEVFSELLIASATSPAVITLFSSPSLTATLPRVTVGAPAFATSTV
ncbi:hypothetical protein COK_1396 [Mannheimia haemolytica serotype A2 str. BOVINE]|nr:hypothetical protein COK_1396 [Mannheimia haemolytica serotype A2 str. BOVINE]